MKRALFFLFESRYTGCDVLLPIKKFLLSRHWYGAKANYVCGKSAVPKISFTHCCQWSKAILPHQPIKNAYNSFQSPDLLQANIAVN